VEELSRTATEAPAAQFDAAMIQTEPYLSRIFAQIIDELIEALWQSPFGLVAAFLCGVTASAFFTLRPVFAQRRGLDTGGVAGFMASGTLGAFLMAWPPGRLSDRSDRLVVIIGAAVTAAVNLFTWSLPGRASGPSWDHARVGTFKSF
jgi:hypothetical protein